MATREVQIGVLGMSCGGCAARVENFIREKVEGVQSVQVDLDGNKVLVGFDETKTDLSRIAAAVEMAGYQPVLPEE